MEKNKLLIISLDALSSDNASSLLECPTFSKLAEGGTLVNNTKTVYLSNTYPIHTSIVTGCHPYKHGVFDNALPIPGDSRPAWNWYAKAIRVPTIYDVASAHGLATASIMWPVTAKAAIRYNMPEIIAKKPRENQILVSLASGSPFMQLRAFLKYGRRLAGVSQPQLDDFSCNTMCDLIRRKKPDLMMIHLTDADTHKHHHGADSEKAFSAIKRLDRRIEDLLLALDDAGISEETHIIILSDHGMTNVNRSINPNRLLENAGLISYKKDGTLNFWKTWIKCSGGSGFLYLKDPQDLNSLKLATDILVHASKDPGSGIGPFVDDEEFRLSGLDQECCFGIEAADGVEFSEYRKHAYKANHGYSLRSGKYNTFYLLHGPRIKKGLSVCGGSLLDIAPLAAELLGLPLWEMDGVLIKDYLLD